MNKSAVKLSATIEVDCLAVNRNIGMGDFRVPIGVLERIEYDEPSFVHAERIKIALELFVGFDAVLRVIRRELYFHCVFVAVEDYAQI